MLAARGRRGVRRALLRRLEGNWRPGVLGAALTSLKDLPTALIFFLPVYHSNDKYIFKFCSKVDGEPCN